MKLPPLITILYEIESWQILSPAIMPKITSKIVLDIRKCKQAF